jgi:ArsR family transcriptional regulator, arsenate/arsenite/antimonite-responsive transcriptional repressor
MKETIEMFKALGDEHRFRIFMLLQHKRMCVCELLTVFDIAGSTLSAHLKILRTAGLIEQRKDGRWIEYHVSPENGNAARLYELISDELLVDRSVIDADRTRVQGLTREVCSKGI